MTRADVMQLFHHMEWADSVIWSSVEATEAARQDPVVMERLHHVHLVQRIYLQMWLRKPDRGRELASFEGLSALHDWAQDYYRELRTFLGTLNDTTLGAPVEFPWADELVKWFGEVRPATIHETMIQVAMHTSHHRGQLCTMVRQLGGTPPLVDFIGWIWMGKPEPSWQSGITS
jgi:uncharacterized damage-inducible protein DinB